MLSITLGSSVSSLSEARKGLGIKDLVIAEEVTVSSPMNGTGSKVNL